jgi:integrase
VAPCQKTFVRSIARARICDPFTSSHDTHAWAGTQFQDRFRLHDPRVSFCTNHVAAGTSAPQLMKLGRHHSIATTMRFYRGQTDAADRQAAAQMERYLVEFGKQKAEKSGVENKMENCSPSPSGKR